MVGTGMFQWRSKGPAGPATAGVPAGLKGPARNVDGYANQMEIELTSILDKVAPLNRP